MSDDKEDKRKDAGVEGAPAELRPLEWDKSFPHPVSKRSFPGLYDSEGVKGDKWWVWTFLTEVHSDEPVEELVGRSWEYLIRYQTRTMYPGKQLIEYEGGRSLGEWAITGKAIADSHGLFDEVQEADLSHPEPTDMVDDRVMRALVVKMLRSTPELGVSEVFTQMEASGRPVRWGVVRDHIYKALMDNSDQLRKDVGEDVPEEAFFDVCAEWLKVAALEETAVGFGKKIAMPYMDLKEFPPIGMLEPLMKACTNYFLELPLRLADRAEALPSDLEAWAVRFFGSSENPASGFVGRMIMHYKLKPSDPLLGRLNEVYNKEVRTLGRLMELLRKNPRLVLRKGPLDGEDLVRYQQSVDEIKRLDRQRGEE